MTDELFDLRTALYVGSYHHVVAEAHVVRCASKKPNDVAAFNVERDVLLSLAQVGLGQFEAVMVELDGATHPALCATRIAAQAAREAASSPNGMAIESTLSAARALVAPGPTAHPTAVVTALTALVLGGATSEALRAALDVVAASDAYGLSPQHIIEVHALLVDLYIRWHRTDIAEREWQTMKRLDDEHVLTMLCGVAVCLRLAHSKSDRLTEAATLLQDLGSRCGQGTVLLNLHALQKGLSGQWGDADRSLLDALSRRAADAVTTTNLVTTAAQLQKSAELQSRYFQQAKAAGGAWAAEVARLEAYFA